MALYPLKFKPSYHYRIWGGEKLKTVFYKEYTEESIGESWEISTVPNSETQVSNGVLKGKTINELINEFEADFLGEEVYKRFGKEFPLLIKFIDAKTPLSIQVHPDDQLAKERHNSFGKNEMWYVMEADKDSELIIGFNKELNKKSYLEAINKGEIEDVLNSVKVEEGDTFFIPAGRVHAIGAGVLIAEIQQTSDVTYRIFDFDRVDKKTGFKRELHTKQSIEAIDYKLIENYKTNYSLDTSKNKLVHTRYFKTDILVVKGNLKLELSRKTFIILICVEGESNLSYQNKSYALRKGEIILIPSNLKEDVELSATFSKLLEVYL
jgi:mannose-6-phosphate isomerase